MHPMPVSFRRESFVPQSYAPAVRMAAYRSLIVPAAMPGSTRKRRIWLAGQRLIELPISARQPSLN